MRKHAAITRTQSSGGLITTRGRVYLEWENHPVLGLETLAFEECSLGV
jgi:hypothetical protein